MKKVDRNPDKYCVLCKKAIYNGENGCAMYNTCFECKPIRYVAKPRKGPAPLNFEMKWPY